MRPAPSNGVSQEESGGSQASRSGLVYRRARIPLSEFAVIQALFALGRPNLTDSCICRLPWATSSVATKSLRPSGRVAWARCTARAIPSSTAKPPSRFFLPLWRKIPNGWRDSSAKRSCAGGIQSLEYRAHLRGRGIGRRPWAGDGGGACGPFLRGTGSASGDAAPEFWSQLRRLLYTIPSWEAKVRIPGEAFTHTRATTTEAV